MATSISNSTPLSERIIINLFYKKRESFLRRPQLPKQIVGWSAIVMGCALIATWIWLTAFGGYDFQGPVGNTNE